MAKEKYFKDEAYLENIDLDELAARVKRILDIRDRKYGFPPKTYPKCFVGKTNESIFGVAAADKF